MITDLPDPPARPGDAHKGTFGSVLIIGGSAGMNGAVALAGMAALRSGAGLVTLAIPETILATVASYHPSYMTIGLPADDSGRIAAEAQQQLLELADRYQAVALGPGIGQSTGLQKIIAALYSELTCPMVVDADALNGLAKIQQGDNNSNSAVNKLTHGGPRILTPHPGEFSRLTGLETSVIESARQEHATRYAREHNITLLLKGHQTLITDGQRVAINDTGNSGMATGGSGDVLTGLTAGLLAQGMQVFEAGQLAAHLHGLAGDIAAADLTEPALTSNDLVDYLPSAWQSLLGFD